MAEAKKEPKVMDSKKGNRIAGCVIGGIVLFIVLVIVIGVSGAKDEAGKVAVSPTSTATAKVLTPEEQAKKDADDAAAKKKADDEKAQKEAEVKAQKEVADKAKAEADAKANAPADFKSALNQATSYSNTMHMSKRGVYDQLVSEYGGKFTAEAAQYGIDNVKADWNANALAQAKTYQDTMSMSPAAVRDQLVSEYGGKFTASEADYAIQHLND